MRKLVLAVVRGVVGAGAFPGTGRSQGPVPMYPENYKVLFEDDGWSQTGVLGFNFTYSFGADVMMPGDGGVMMMPDMASP